MEWQISCFIFIALSCGLTAANEVNLEPAFYRTTSTNNNLTKDGYTETYVRELQTRLDTTKEMLCQQKIDNAHLYEKLQACNASRSVDRFISQMRLSMELMNATQKCNKCCSNCSTENKNESVTDLCKTAGKDLEMIQLSTGRYFFSGTIIHNWYNALKFCRSHGLDLLSIENMAEQKAVTEKAAQLYPNKGLVTSENDSDRENYCTPEDDSILMSGTDQGQEGQWFWASTGQNLSTFSVWHSGQPDNYGGVQHCATFWNIGGDSKWDDKSCQTKYKFVCELPAYCMGNI